MVNLTILHSFNRRQMISIESATTPHSFNSLLLLPLLPLPSSIQMRLLFLSMKSMFIKCIDFHDKNTSRRSLSIVEINVPIPNVLIFTLTIIIYFYLACIVNCNAFFISFVDINVYQSIDFHNKNN